MLLKKNINETYIRAILISFIVNYNIIRITFDFIPAINNFIYLLFISYFFCSLNKRIKLKMNVISICALGIILYVIVSSIVNGNFINHFDILLKFLLGILISLLIVNENKKEFIPIFLNTTVNINTLYSILIILNSIKPYGLGTIASVNYLEWTLSIGFSVSILQNLLLFSNNNKIKNLIKLIIQYICLFLFRARGSILFPIILLILTIMYIMLYRKKLSKKNILIICFIIVIFFVSLNNIENTKVFTRLVNLFYDYNDESRVEIWMNCVNYVKETNGFFIGLGFKGFSNYLI